MLGWHGILLMCLAPEILAKIMICPYISDCGKTMPIVRRNSALCEILFPNCEIYLKREKSESRGEKSDYERKREFERKRN